MALYEHVFVIRQDISSTQVETLTTQFKAIITDNGGTIAKAEYWGIRTLAYRIRKNRKAHFSLLNIDAPSAAVQEMERQMGLNEDVIRFMTIKVDSHDAEPSVMMQQSGRGGRDDRGGRGGYRGDRNREDRPDRGPRSDSGADKPAVESKKAETSVEEAAS